MPFALLHEEMDYEILYQEVDSLTLILKRIAPIRP